MRAKAKSLIFDLFNGVWYEKVGFVVLKFILILGDHGGACVILIDFERVTSTSQPPIAPYRKSHLKV